ATALPASAAEFISTKPNPRDRPVARSVMTDADSQWPTSENSDSRSALVVSKERFPTKIFWPRPCPWPIRGALVVWSRLLGRRDRSSADGTEGPHKQKDDMMCISEARGAHPAGSMPGYQPRAAIDAEPG